MTSRSDKPVVGKIVFETPTRQQLEREHLAKLREFAQQKVDEARKSFGEKSRLAIDPGTNCGWALQTVHGITLHGTWDLKPRRHEGGGMRYLRFLRVLEDTARAGKVEEVAYEEVRGHKGTDAAQIYGGIVATLTQWCEDKQIPYQGVPVGTIKKHATGKGNADKAAMVKAAVAKFGPTVKDDNEADALWLLDWMLAQDGGAK